MWPVSNCPVRAGVTYVNQWEILRILLNENEPIVSFEPFFVGYTASDIDLAQNDTAELVKKQIEDISTEIPVEIRNALKIGIQNQAKLFATKLPEISERWKPIPQAFEYFNEEQLRDLRQLGAVRPSSAMRSVVEALGLKFLNGPLGNA